MVKGIPPSDGGSRGSNLLNGRDAFRRGGPSSSSKKYVVPPPDKTNVTRSEALSVDSIPPASLATRESRHAPASQSSKRENMIGDRNDAADASLSSEAKLYEIVREVQRAAKDSHSNGIDTTRRKEKQEEMRHRIWTALARREKGSSSTESNQKEKMGTVLSAERVESVKSAVRKAAFEPGKQSAFEPLGMTGLSSSRIEPSAIHRRGSRPMPEVGGIEKLHPSKVRVAARIADSNDKHQLHRREDTTEQATTKISVTKERHVTKSTKEPFDDTEKLPLKKEKWPIYSSKSSDQRRFCTPTTAQAQDEGSVCSARTSESSVIHMLRSAQARYERMLRERESSAALVTKHKSTTSSGPINSGPIESFAIDDARLEAATSLRSEDRVPLVPVIANTKNQEKKVSNRPPLPRGSSDRSGSIFRIQRQAESPTPSSSNHHHVTSNEEALDTIQNTDDQVQASQVTFDEQAFNDDNSCVDVKTMKERMSALTQRKTVRSRSYPGMRSGAKKIRSTSVKIQPVQEGPSAAVRPHDTKDDDSLVFSDEDTENLIECSEGVASIPSTQLVPITGQKNRVVFHDSTEITKKFKEELLPNEEAERVNHQAPTGAEIVDKDPASNVTEVDKDPASNITEVDKDPASNITKVDKEPPSHVDADMFVKEEDHRRVAEKNVTPKAVESGAAPAKSGFKQSDSYDTLNVVNDESDYYCFWSSIFASKDKDDSKKGESASFSEEKGNHKDMGGKRAPAPRSFVDAILEEFMNTGVDTAQSSEEKKRILHLGKKMAEEATLPVAEPKKEDAEVSDFVRAYETSIEQAQRRSIGAKVLSVMMLKGYSASNKKESCCDCGMPLLQQGTGPAECVTCPVYARELRKNVERAKEKDHLDKSPHFHAAVALEAEVQNLKSIANEKARAAVVAESSEEALLAAKEEAMKELAKAEEEAADADLDVRWKTKELKKILAVSEAAREEAQNAMRPVLENREGALQEAAENAELANEAHGEAETDYVRALKAQAHAELKVFVADDAVRRAIAQREKAVAAFHDMKKCVAQCKYEVDGRSVEMAWTLEVFSQHEEDLEEQVAAGKEAETKAMALSSAAVQEKEEAEVAFLSAKESVLHAGANVAALQGAIEEASAERIAAFTAVAESMQLVEEKEEVLSHTLEQLRYNVSSDCDFARCTSKNKQESNHIDDPEASSKSDDDGPTETETEAAPVEEEAMISVSISAETCPETPLREEDEAAEIMNAEEGQIKEEEPDQKIIASWNFYREVIGVMDTSWKYQEVSEKLQADPLHPYLNSLPGVNDSQNENKQVEQKFYPKYLDMSQSAICEYLVNDAKALQPQLVKSCKKIAKKMKMKKLGVGPVKDVRAAIEKADRKYEGDVLKVTDYCRAFFIVKDIASLLALIETSFDVFGSRICRVKLSTLKKDHPSLPGGYRDCKLNVTVEKHICEIQIHLETIWDVCDLQGYTHYKESLQYSTDSFDDPYDILHGLDGKTLGLLAKAGMQATKDFPIGQLEPGNQKSFGDHRALAGIMLEQGGKGWEAEALIRKLMKIHQDSNDDHIRGLEIHLKKALEKALRQQKLDKEADEIVSELKDVAQTAKGEKSVWQSLLDDPSLAFEMIVDPAKHDRDYEEEVKVEVNDSKRRWLMAREENFHHLRRKRVADSLLAYLNRKTKT